MIFDEETPFSQAALRVAGVAFVVGTTLALIPFEAIAERIRLERYASQVAAAYHINLQHFRKVIECESQWDPRIQSQYYLPDGTQENSWGIAQFNLDYNDMTKEQALDPEYALTKMAEHWTQGRASAWRCYQLWEARLWK